MEIDKIALIGFFIVFVLICAGVVDDRDYRNHKRMHSLPHTLIDEER